MHDLICTPAAEILTTRAADYCAAQETCGQPVVQLVVCQEFCASLLLSLNTPNLCIPWSVNHQCYLALKVPWHLQAPTAPSTPSRRAAGASWTTMRSGQGPAPPSARPWRAAASSLTLTTAPPPCRCEGTRALWKPHQQSVPLDRFHPPPSPSLASLPSAVGHA